MSESGAGKKSTDLAALLQEIAQRSQRLVAEHVQRLGQGDGYSVLDPKDMLTGVGESLSGASGKAAADADGVLAGCRRAVEARDGKALAAKARRASIRARCGGQAFQGRNVGAEFCL